MGHGNFQWSGRSKALGAVCDDVLYCDFAKTGSRRDAKKNVNEVKSPTHQKEYSDLQKEVNKTLRTDTIAHINGKATKGSQQRKTKRGKLLSPEKDIEKRWTEHFKEFQNKLPPTHEPNIGDIAAA